MPLQSGYWLAGGIMYAPGMDRNLKWFSRKNKTSLLKSKGQRNTFHNSLPELDQRKWIHLYALYGLYKCMSFNLGYPKYNLIECMKQTIPIVLRTQINAIIISFPIFIFEKNSGMLITRRSVRNKEIIDLIWFQFMHAQSSIGFGRQGSARG